MTELHWQVAFLLVAAFFLGAVIACSLKRKFYYRSSTRTDATPVAVTPATTEPKIEAAPRVQADFGSERFGSALAGGASVASSTPAPPVSQPLPEPQPAAVAQPAPDPAAAPEPVPTPAAAFTAQVEPAPARDSAPTVRDVSHLRSVRSEALLGQEAPRPSGTVDDLKRIRGVGVLIEKKLNSLGITSYEQVANWTGADIERVSQILDFKGRIERENWIEQARILATGGQTEFSRRSDA
jgi:predicted flap endonuclease-1-like 5' DNA nuclease